MRAFDRDLIRGGHYGQRSCEPHQQAEHMVAPTNAASVKKVLANSEPSTHGPSPTSCDVRDLVGIEGKAEVTRTSPEDRLSPSRAVTFLHSQGQKQKCVRRY